MGGNVSILCWLVPWGHPGPREGGTFPPGEGWDHYNRGRGGALGPGSLNPSRLLGFRSFCGPLEGLPRPLEVRLRPKMISVSRKIPLQVFCTSSILEWGLVMGRLREPYGGGLFLLKSRRADAQLESHKEVVTLVPGELEVCFQCWAHEFLHVTESFYYSVVGKLSTMMRTILKTVIIKGISTHGMDAKYLEEAKEQLESAFMVLSGCKEPCLQFRHTFALFCAARPGQTNPSNLGSNITPTTFDMCLRSKCFRELYLK